MNTTTIEATADFPLPMRSTAGDPRATGWRIGLAVAATLACGMAAIVGEPSTLGQTDPALAQLLRGMALIKASMTIGALGLLWWRLGRPIRPPVAVASGLAIAAMAAATVSIWRLASLLPAALLFHAGLFTLLFLGVRAGSVATRPRRPRAEATAAAPVRPA